MGKKRKKGAAGAACLLLALLLALTLAACGKKDDSSTSAPASEAGSSSVPPAPSVSVAASAPASVPASQVAQPVAAAAIQPNLGRFYHLEGSRYPDERAPYLELMEDGKALFRLNSGSALGQATGSYSVSGKVLTLTIESLEIEPPFAGTMIASLQFEVLNPDNLRYSGNAYGLTLKGNVFTLEGAEYSEDPPPAPASSEAAVPSAVDPSQSLPQSASSAPAPESLPAASSLPAVSSSVQEVKQGSFPWLILVIAAGALVVGSVATVVLMSVLRKGKKGAATPAGEQAESAENAGDALSATGKKLKGATREEKQTRKEAAKAKKEAAAKEKKANKTARDAAKAKVKAERAARDAEKAKEKADAAVAAADEAGKLASAAAAAREAAIKVAAETAEQAVLSNEELPSFGQLTNAPATAEAPPQPETPPDGAEPPIPPAEEPPAPPAEEPPVAEEEIVLLSEVVSPEKNHDTQPPGGDEDLADPVFTAQLPAGGGVLLDEMELMGETPEPAEGKAPPKAPPEKTGQENKAPVENEGEGESGEKGEAPAQDTRPDDENPDEAPKVVLADDMDTLEL